MVRLDILAGKDIRMVRTIVIGGGVSGLSAACHLAAAGSDVHLLERHSMLGGRARVWQQEGFTFDMGPSWYWMPDIYERFFNAFGSSSGEHYELRRLDPSYRVFWEDGRIVDVPASFAALQDLFEQWELGSAAKLVEFMQIAKKTYERGMLSYAFRPSLGLWEFCDFEFLRESLRLGLLRSLRSQVAEFFQHPFLRQLVEFPVLFLGAGADRIPAIYSLMTYADMVLGTWYPMGGMYKVIEGMAHVAESVGVRLNTGCDVSRISVAQHRVVGIELGRGGSSSLLFNEEGSNEEDARAANACATDVVVCAADYHHGDQDLLLPEHRSYSKRYWRKRTLAPSCLLFYLGVKGRVSGLLHHNLFFDESLDEHAFEIYTQPRWPHKPLFYVCAPSKTDPSVAPPDCENLFVLIPVAPGLSEDDELVAKYFAYVLDKIKQWTGEDISNRLLVKRVYAPSEFQRDYRALRGNAYGLANTLLQTAWLKPRLKSKRVKGLYYTGQLTVPGPGVPPCLISGEVVAKVIQEDFGLGNKKLRYNLDVVKKNKLHQTGVSA